MKGDLKLSPLHALSQDIASLNIDLANNEWDEFSKICIEKRYSKNEILIEGDTQNNAGPLVAEYLIFITQGVAAAQIETRNGQRIVLRFFEAGDFSTPIRSGTRGEPDESSIIAITPVEGVLIPLAKWRREQVEGLGIGRYAREKMFRAHMLDLDILRVKSLNRTSESYGFLEDHQPNVLKAVPQKIIAQFLGITPEGLSRFLKTRS